MFLYKYLQQDEHSSNFSVLGPRVKLLWIKQPSLLQAPLKIAKNSIFSY